MMVRMAALLMFALLASCTTMQAPPEEQIIGRWQSNVAGFPVTVTYDGTTVQMGQQSPVTYTLVGDELKFDQGGSQVRKVSFAGSNTMLQMDPLTGTTQEYTRVP